MHENTRPLHHFAGGGGNVSPPLPMPASAIEALRQFCRGHASLRRWEFSSWAWRQWCIFQLFAWERGSCDWKYRLSWPYQVFWSYALYSTYVNNRKSYHWRHWHRPAGDTLWGPGEVTPEWNNKIVAEFRKNTGQTRSDGRGLHLTAKKSSPCTL